MSAVVRGRPRERLRNAPVFLTAIANVTGSWDCDRNQKRLQFVMPRTRTLSGTAREASALLGLQVRVARKERGMTQGELAERAGISRSSLAKVERGDPRVEIGLAFEAAATVGVPLFEGREVSTVAVERDRLRSMLALLPRSVRRSDANIDDDF